MDAYVHGFVTPLAPIILLYVAFNASKFVFFGVSLTIVLSMLIAVILTEQIGVNSGLKELDAG